MGEAAIGRRAIFGGPALAGTIVTAVAVAVAAILAGGWTTENLRLALRVTARLSVTLFALVFVASPVFRLWGGRFGRWLIRERRYLGLAFGGVHLIHGSVVVTLAASRHGGDLTALSPAPAIVGGVGVYLVIIVMMLTSTDGAVRRLGPSRWKRLHRFGLWVVFTVFLADYTAKALDSGGLFWVPAALLSAALGLRFGVWLREGWSR